MKEKIISKINNEEMLAQILISCFLNNDLQRDISNRINDENLLCKIIIEFSDSDNTDFEYEFKLELLERISNKKIINKVFDSTNIW